MIVSSLMRKARVLLCAVGFGLFAATSAAQEGQQSSNEFREYAMEQLRRGRLPGAIRQLEALVANPPAHANSLDRASFPVDLIELYAIEAQFEGRLSGPATDRRVDELYRQALHFNPPELAYQVESTYAYYLNVTDQTGAAMQHFRTALRDPNMSQDPGSEYAALGQIAAAYMDMGNFDYAAAALARARAVESRLPAAIRTDAHLTLSPLEMSLLLSQGNPAALSALARADQILIRSNAVTAEKRVQASIAQLIYLNQIHDEQAAQQAETIVRENAARGLPSEIRDQVPASMRRDLANAIVDCLTLVVGNPETLAADPNYSSRLSTCEQVGLNMPAMQGQLRATPALVLERQGRDGEATRIYEDMISHAERSRESFDVAQRQAFFAGRWRVPYDGLTRIDTRAFLRQNYISSFMRALIDVDRTRARQFGELRGDHADFGTPESIGAFVRSLPLGTAVVVLSSHDSEQMAFGFTQTMRRAAIIPITASSLNARVNTVRGLLEDADADLPAIDEHMDALSRDALGSVRDVLAGATDIIVIVDGPLARVPFNLFTAADNAPFIGDTANVSYRLSLRALRSERRTATGRGLFAVGGAHYPDAPPAIPLDDNVGLERIDAYRGVIDLRPLPFTRAEAIRLGASFDPSAAAPALNDQSSRGVSGAGMRVLLGDAATEAAVRRSIVEARYVHLGSHGLLAGTYGLVEPAIVLSAGDGEDGFLTVSEIASLRMSAELTVLSACSSGDGRVVAGEGAISLARAFLIAGSRDVLVSMWQINDAKTSDWMADFYERLHAGALPAVALRETNTYMRQTVSEPKFWAPFILVSG